MSAQVMSEESAGEPAGRSVELRVEGLDCPDCAASLEKAVRSLPQVESARVLFAASKLQLTYRGSDQVVEAIRDLADSMGYEIAPETGGHQLRSSGWRERLARHRRDVATAAGGLLMALALGAGLLGAPRALSQALYVASILVSGVYVVRAGWVALRTAHSLDMNVLMTIAAIGAVALGEFEEAALTLLLFSVGELLESHSMDRARNAVRALMELAPEEATVLDGEREALVMAAQVKVGERILVRPGERLPLDGRVLEGRSAVDQSPVTGESMPVERGEGDQVYAGTINGNGALVVEVTRLAQDSTVARVRRLVEEAQAHRAPTERFVDRFARIYTPSVVGLAALVAVVPPLIGLGSLGEWSYKALVMLVISCPCALVIATPVTIVSALVRAARSGVLIKGGSYIEELASVRAIAFDKTGTLTEGKPYVVEGACEFHQGDLDECANCQTLLAMAASLESRSEHALGRAVTEYARARGVSGRYPPGEAVTAVPGVGIEGLVGGHEVSVGKPAHGLGGDGDGTSLEARVADAERKGYTVFVVEDACCGARCSLAVSDRLRPEAGAAIHELRRAGIEHTVMLSGDNATVAKSIAAQIGIDEVRAELLPEDKVTAMADLLKRYGRVAMVGDGVNDAPAMARATVGIAMGAGGTDVALETADVALMTDDLGRIPFIIRLSRTALRLVRANIAVSLLLKALFLGLAAAGLSTMWMAVLADTGTSLLVTLNGLRMLRFGQRPGMPGRQRRTPGPGRTALQPTAGSGPPGR